MIYVQMKRYYQIYPFYLKENLSLCSKTPLLCKNAHSGPVYAHFRALKILSCDQIYFLILKLMTIYVKDEEISLISMKTLFLCWKIPFSVKMLVQGQNGLPLHIFQKTNLSRPFFIKIHVDGGIQRLSFLYFHTFSKILPFGDTLLIVVDTLRSIKSSFGSKVSMIRRAGHHDGKGRPTLSVNIIVSLQANTNVYIETILRL